MSYRQKIGNDRSPSLDIPCSSRTRSSSQFHCLNLPAIQTPEIAEISLKCEYQHTSRQQSFQVPFTVYTCNGVPYPWGGNPQLHISRSPQHFQSILCKIIHQNGSYSNNKKKPRWVDDPGKWDLLEHIEIMRMTDLHRTPIFNNRVAVRNRTVLDYKTAACPISPYYAPINPCKWVVHVPLENCVCIDSG